MEIMTGMQPYLSTVVIGLIWATIASRADKEPRIK